MNYILSWYSIRSTKTILYMLQQVNYDPKKFLVWTLRLFKNKQSLNRVAYRKQLVSTKKIKLLKKFIFLTGSLFYIVSFVLILLKTDNFTTIFLFFSLIILLPLLKILFVTIICLPVFIVLKNQALFPEVKASEALFKKATAIKIAVAGSYGKTSIKELLYTVLSEKYNVKTTPGNMNTPIAHARFAQALQGNEDILIIEYGEEHPGDVTRFAKTTHPDYGFITGIAPNHLEYYKSLDKLTNDIFSLRNFVKPGKLYVSADNKFLKKHLKSNDKVFDQDSVAGWEISNVTLDITGTQFCLQKGNETINLKTSLLGRHQIPVVGVVAVLAYELGLTISQIERAVSKTEPFEHRMKPYKLGAAWVIDDTYNGNLQGILAGLSLLNELNFKRKIYVTPGLVDQGNQTESVHHEIAKKLYDVAPDIIVLMKNTSTDIIDDALNKLGYVGKVQIISNPLSFYESLEQFVIPGDLVLMQNDWPDNYN